MFRRLVLGMAVLQQAAGVINSLTGHTGTFTFLNLPALQRVASALKKRCKKLNEEELDRLPPLFEMDKYYRCHREKGNYCWLKAKIIGNSSNPIYNTLEEYSLNKIAHYDRTFVYRGLCPKRTCPDIDRNSTDPMQAMESCLNSNMYKEYQLNTSVVKSLCTDYKDEVILDASDYAFAAVVFILLVLNVLGSLYDFYWSHGTQGNKTCVGKFLVCFSVKNNWNRLLAPSSSTGNSKMGRLKCLSAFRTVNIIMVVIVHAAVRVVLIANNTDYVETMFSQTIYHMIFSATLIIQTFLIMSGLLLTYNFIAAKSTQHWWMLPKKVMLRWLRLTPPYALTMFFVMTWARHVGEGPFWQIIVTEESEDCRRNWWLHLLYIHNYRDHSQCMAHAWYLAADMQLSVLGLIILYLLKSSKARKIAIGLVFVVGLVTPSAHTYFQDLHPILIVTPETAFNFFVHDRTFNNLYKRTHTNIACYGMGMALAYIIYKLQDSDIGSPKFKKFRTFNWLLFPFELCFMLTGSAFYFEDIPLAARTVYSSAIKVAFGLTICLHILLTSVKVDRLCRRVFHWNGWTYLGRLTYCAYVIHVCIIRTSIGGEDSLTRISVYSYLMNIISVVATTFILAFPVHMLVEAPFGCLVKTYLDSGKSQPKSKPVSVVDLHKHDKDAAVVKVEPNKEECQ